MHRPYHRHASARTSQHTEQASRLTCHLESKDGNSEMAGIKIARVRGVFSKNLTSTHVRAVTVINIHTAWLWLWLLDLEAHNKIPFPRSGMLCYHLSHPLDPLDHYLMSCGIRSQIYTTCKKGKEKVPAIWCKHT